MKTTIDHFSRKVEEEFLKYLNQPESELSPITVLEQTDLIPYCRLYAARSDTGEEQFSFSVRDIVEIAHYATRWFPDLDAVKQYLDLFSEQSQLYQLRQWFTEQSLPQVQFSYVTHTLKSCLPNAEFPEAKNVERVMGLLNTEPAKMFHLQYGRHYRAYEAVVGTALEDLPKAEAIIACLNDERVRARFLDDYVTFPKNFEHRLYDNRDIFRDGILQKTMQDPKPEAVVKFIEKTKRRWIALFREEAL